MLDPEDYNLGENRPKKNVLADFTGRELLISSLQEKCYHNELKQIIANNRHDNEDLEKKFIDQMV